MHILNKTNINFMRWRWHAVALSWVVILAGLAVIATRGLPRGIEFAGGLSRIVVTLRFDFDRRIRNPVSTREIDSRLFHVDLCLRDFDFWPAREHQRSRSVHRNVEGSDSYFFRLTERRESVAIHQYVKL